MSLCESKDIFEGRPGVFQEGVNSRIPMFSGKTGVIISGSEILLALQFIVC